MAKLPLFQIGDKFSIIEETIQRIELTEEGTVYETEGLRIVPMLLGQLLKRGVIVHRPTPDGIVQVWPEVEG